jgi:uncharacterized RmlC-like cupin family protein
MPEPRAVGPEHLREPALVTPGIDRREAFADDRIWVGTARTEAGVWSGWHVHPGHDTYAYAIEGRIRVEFDAAGAGIEAGPGGFLFIPKGAPHREGNPGDEPNVGVVFRIGEGPVLEPLDGPPDA